MSRRLSKIYPLLLFFIWTNLVISMPAPPPSRRSFEAASGDVAGFSNVPKILEIQLPLRIATKEDLVAWARYVMGLMASRINITLTTVKESPSRVVGGGTEKMAKQARQYPVRNNPAYRYFEADGSTAMDDDGLRHLVKSFENARYAENARSLGRATSIDKIPAPVRIVGDVENSARNGDVQSYSTSRLPTIAMVDGAIGKSSFNDRRPIFQPIFAISDSTIPSPLDVNIPGASKHPIDDSFDSANSLKTGDRQLFVPQFPNFGPAIELKPNDIFPTSAVSPPTRAYLPVATTTVAAHDNVEFPNDPFVARYLLYGRNVSSNLLPDTVAPLLEIASSPPTGRNVSPSRNDIGNTTTATPLFNVPFEAVITFTRDHIRPTADSRDEGGEYSALEDRFPPYFEYTSNRTLTNESGQINVVLDDEGRTIEAGVKEERRKEERKKDEGSKGKKSKKRKPEKKTSPLGQLIKSFAALRRNSTLATNLAPPLPSKQQTSSTTQRIPSRQEIPPPTRTQLYSTTEKTVSKGG